MSGPLFLIDVCFDQYWKRKWQPTPVFLPGKSHGRRNLVGYSPWGPKELDRTERLHFHFHCDQYVAYIHLSFDLIVFHLMICATITVRSIIPLVIPKWWTSNSVTIYACIRQNSFDKKQTKLKEKKKNSLVNYKNNRTNIKLLPLFSEF